jgi:hypothetical protein
VLTLQHDALSILILFGALFARLGEPVGVPVGVPVAESQSKSHGSNVSSGSPDFVQLLRRERAPEQMTKQIGLRFERSHSGVVKQSKSALRRPLAFRRQCGSECSRHAAFCALSQFFPADAH